MKMSSWLRARPKTLASVSVVSAVAVTLGALAFVYEGKPTTEVDLNDGGVWVTKQSSMLLGHFNHQSAVLDGGLRAASTQFDIQQSASRVLMVDQTAGTATAVDPARVTLGDSAEIPPGSQIVLGADQVAVVDPAGGLRGTPFTALSSYAPKDDPLVELGQGGITTVAVDGTVYAASAADAKLYAFGRTADDTLALSGERALEGVLPAHTLQLTAVGNTAYVLDESTDTLYGSDGSQVTVPADAVVQQPSVEATAVTLATPDALLRVPRGGGEIVTIATDAGKGTPAAPAYVAGCAYGAWSGSGMFVRDCAGESSDVVEEIEGLDAASNLQFRVNRDIVVLNDVFGGAAWMASDAMQRVDDWDDITPPEGEGEEQEETTEETVQTTLPERTEVNTPPIANDDSYGVRPGRSTILPVLENDTDADGDVLVATADADQQLGTVSQIYNGAALQIEVPEDATGSTSFTYTVEDGRGGEASAKVTLTVHGWDENSPPVQKRRTPVVVETGGTASYNVLADWIDPDGDDIFLLDVAPDGGDEADFTSDGQITYRAIGGVAGRKEMPISVSDGTLTGGGVAVYDIRPLGSTVPITNADHVVTRVGQPVVVTPLTNDTSSGSEQLRLTRVDEVADATVLPDYADKSFTFTSNVEKTHYVQYLASAGPNSVPGIVRVDVLPASDETAPPVAVRDVALLPAGGDVLVNVLSNDTDPAGGILVVQSVSAPAGTGAAAAVLGHETVRITDQGGVDEQVRVQYTISNGSASATGEIIVIPVPAPARLRPPVADDDQAVVRVGDVVTIPVLDNDYHPNGDVIHLAPDLVPPGIEAADGEAFISEDTLRFRAGDEPKTVYATYEAVDSTGQKDAALVTIQIVPRNDEANAAPRPRDLTARVLGGSNVDIPVPLDGIDEDGDSVELVGAASAPAKGRIVSTGANTFRYEAFEDSFGVDSFTYRVRDRLGKEATATVQVGIAPVASTNQAPYAVRDAIVMRPDREVAVPVLENDSDPDGDRFNFAEDGLEVPSDVPGLKATIAGEYLVISSPAEELNTSVSYTIEDARGLRATASVQITVDEDVPLIPPIARDDRVLPEEVSEEGVAEVAVLENDDDPDGTKSALEVTLGTGGDNATVNRDGVVTVTLTEEPQLITYTVRDRDDQTASAFIRVPGLSQLPPTLIDATRAIEVASGETIEVPLAEYVRAAGGKSVVITEAGKVAAAHANGASLVKDQTTLVYTSADRYFGADALTFEVTDGTGPDDPDGRKATLTIPITVLPPENQQPTMVGAAMSVAPGEDPSTLDLASLATDPDPGDAEKLRFSLVGNAPAGLSASVVDGSILTVSAPANTDKGTQASLMVRVTDGETEPVEAPITVTVTASTRELASANDDVIEQSDQGELQSIPVLSNDVNPFPDTPLKIVDAVRETGDTSAVRVNGDRVEVTSTKDFVGTIVVRYTVEDKTEDVDRRVEGRIRLTVQGRPDAPGKPTVSSVQSRTVVLSWTPPIDNGTPITGYTVTSTRGASDYSKQCSATTCTLDGLTNNVEYNFTVTATNRVGESDPSVPSETARPDVRPETPAPPSLRFGDQSLNVSWTVPRTEGSPVETYTLEISPAPPSGVVQKTGLKGTSTVWEGLENGVNYQVRVQAHNRAPEPSGFSGWSAGEVPARAPEAPAAPTTSRLDPVGSQAQIQVNWVAPKDNGDRIAGYQLQVLQGSSVVRTVNVAAGTTSQAVVVDTSQTDYTFQVRAQNKAGWGQWSAASAPRRGVNEPGAPTGVSASEGNNTVGVTWTAGAANGARANEISYQYSVNGGGWQSGWASGGSNGSGTIGGGQVNNNGAYTIRVRAVSSVGGSTFASGPSNDSNQVRPYGPIGNPTARASASGTTITMSWSSPSRNGRDITTEIRTGDGRGWRTVGASGTENYDVGYSTTRTIEVRTSAAGQTTTASASARTQDAPPPPSPRVWVTKGSYGDSCTLGACLKFVVNFRDANMGNMSVRCYSDAYPGGFGSTYTVNFNGNGSQEIGCYHGQDGRNVWVDILGWGGGVDTEKTFWARP
ncbi:Ig-like domain-containing protein [Microbacterium sp. W1N]|uniref:Ig-like domain-containing protein n=1 Tax=Microbacterium festucae TaxID=2977531 RepID=UPI0021BF6F45|nr:Ig-like domain-containing protein [Microbacterium festucae]MCT9819252.1 Ig-like domain-containing protein [Microbacterium festucae]